MKERRFIFIPLGLFFSVKSLDKAINATSKGNKMGDISDLSAAEREALVEQAIDRLIKRDRDSGRQAGGDFLGERIAGSVSNRTISPETLRADLKAHFVSLINSPDTEGFVKVEGKEVVLHNAQARTAIILNTRSGQSDALSTNDPQWIRNQRDYWAARLEEGRTHYDRSLNPLLSKQSESLIAQRGQGGLANIEAAHRARLSGGPLAISPQDAAAFLIEDNKTLPPAETTITDPRRLLGDGRKTSGANATSSPETSTGGSNNDTPRVQEAITATTAETDRKTRTSRINPLGLSDSGTVTTETPRTPRYTKFSPLSPLGLTEHLPDAEIDPAQFTYSRVNPLSPVEGAPTPTRLQSFLNSTPVKALRLADDVFDTIQFGQFVFEETGLRDAVLDPKPEDLLAREGMLKRSQRYGIDALEKTDNATGLVPYVGNTATALSWGAFFVGAKGMTKNMLETVNSYNTTNETRDQRIERWRNVAQSIPTQELMGYTQGQGVPRSLANFSRNMADFMERFPHASRGDVFVLMHQENNAILKEMFASTPHWDTVERFMRDVPVADVRKAYARLAQENSTGVLTDSPLFIDKFKVPDQLTLFYATGDSPFTFPGAPTLNTAALVDDYARNYTTAISNPLLKTSILDLYTLTGERQSRGLPIDQLLRMTPAEREQHDQQQLEYRRENLAAADQDARTAATEIATRATRALEAEYLAMKMGIEQNMAGFSQRIQREFQVTQEALALTNKTLADIDRSEDAGTAGSLEYRQQWVEYGQAHQKRFDDYLAKQTDSLRERIDTRVRAYTQNRDALLHGGTLSDGQRVEGLQTNLNRWKHENAPPVTFSGLKNYVGEGPAMTVNIPQLVERLTTPQTTRVSLVQNPSETMPEGSRAEYIRGPDGTPFTTHVSGLIQGEPDVDLDMGVTVDSLPVREVFSQSANPSQDMISYVDPRESLEAPAYDNELVYTAQTSRGYAAAKSGGIKTPSLAS